MNACCRKKKEQFKAYNYTEVLGKRSLFRKLIGKEGFGPVCLMIYRLIILVSYNVISTYKNHTIHLEELIPTY